MLNKIIEGAPIWVSVGASDAELMELVKRSLDLLAEGNYDLVFQQLGYALAFGEGASAIRRAIESYRSPQFFPDVMEFHVTDWRSASGGNPEPLALVRRYSYSVSLPIVATIEIHLPLNGKWSDLEADFVVMVKTAADREGVLRLEDISAPRECDV